MLRFVVCDDDKIFCEKEKDFIEKFYRKIGLTAHVDIFDSAEKILSLGKKITAYDAIFIDVSVDKVNGIDVAERLKKTAPEMIIVFVSGYVSYAPDGYKVGAVRYILKDEDAFYSSMEECLKYVLRKARERRSKYISINEKKLRISVDKISYVDSKLHKITFHLKDLYGDEEEYSIYGKLDDAEAELSKYGFFRIHQSYLVNMDLVCDVQRYTVTLTDGRTVPVSKSRYKAVEEAFSKMLF